MCSSENAATGQPLKEVLHSEHMPEAGKVSRQPEPLHEALPSAKHPSLARGGW